MFGPVNLDLGVPRSGSSDPKSGLREAQVHTVSVKTHVIVATLIQMIKNGSKKLELKDKDTGVYVKDLSTFVVKNPGDLNDVFDEGNLNRHVAAT